MVNSRFKFRAWDKDRNEWYLSYATFYKDGELFSDDLLKFDTPNKEITLSKDNLIIEQYTGLKDKNGVEIYEGDVLDHPMQGKRIVYYPFNERVASYGLREISTGMSSTLQDSHRVYEIIGNIHEGEVHDEKNR